MSFSIQGPYTYQDGSGGQSPRGMKYRTGWRLHYIHAVALLGTLLRAVWRG